MIMMSDILFSVKAVYYAGCSPPKRRMQGAVPPPKNHSEQRVKKTSASLTHCHPQWYGPEAHRVFLHPGFVADSTKLQCKLLCLLTHASLHATWSRSCVVTFTVTCSFHVETESDKDSSQDLEATLTASTWAPCSLIAARYWQWLAKRPRRELAANRRTNCL